jgi:hypothetical protein
VSEMYWRRVGDSVQLQGRFTVGTTTAVEARLSLPMNLTADGNKLGPTLNTLASIGTSEAATTTIFGHYVSVEPDVGYIVFSRRVSTSNETVKVNGNTHYASGDEIMIPPITIPIAEWSNSSALMSTSAMMNQSAGVEAYRNAAASHTSGVGTWQAITLDAEVSDDASEFASGVYTARASGYRTLSGQVYFDAVATGTNVFGARITVNGTEVTQAIRFAGGAGDIPAYVMPKRVWLNAGDTVQLEAYQNESASEAYLVGNRAYTFLSVQSEPNFTVYGAHVGDDVVTTPDISQPKMYAARLNCDAGSAITSDPANLVSTIGNISGGACALTWESGVFSTAVFCQAIVQSSGVFANLSGAPTTTGVTIDCAQHENSACVSYDFDLMCWGY